jgi:hypothetical protein
MLMAVAALLCLDMYSKVGFTAAQPQTPLPDTGAQLYSVIDELKNTNKHLDALQALLESGNVTVKTHSIDDKAAK